MLFDGPDMLDRELLQRADIAPGKRRRPLGPRGAGKSPLHRHEQRVVIEPVGILRAELSIGGAIDVACAIVEPSEGLGKQLLLVLDGGRENHVAFRKRRRLGQAVEEAYLDQSLGRDEKRVSGEGGWAGVRRESEPDGHEGKDLPDPLSCIGQMVRKAKRIVPKITNAVPAWKGRDVK